MDVPATKPKFIERLEDDYIVREPAKQKPVEPKITAPVVPAPALHGNGKAPSVVTAELPIETREKNQSSFPFGTGI
jgi:hypothetical protein